MIKKLYDALFSDDYVLFSDEDSRNVTILNDEMDFLTIDLNNMSHDDANFEDDLKIIIHVRLLAWHNRRK